MLSGCLFLASFLLLQLSFQTTHGIPLSKFYLFGEDAGDNVLERTDDGSSPSIKLVFPFYGHEYDQLYVNSNGHITFLTPIGSYIPQIFPLSDRLPMIAPFWADSDTRTQNGGRIWFRESNDTSYLLQTTSLIRSTYLGVDTFNATFMFIATWDHIGYFSRRTDRNNTFQCVLVTDGEISFVIFLYADGLIQWVWGTNHVGNPAEVGVNAGDGIRFFRHPDSNTTALLNIPSTSNVNESGMWVIRTDREGIPKQGCRKGENVPITLIPKSGNMLGGTGVTISGPCFAGNIKCKFDDKEVNGIEISNSLLLCVTPEINRSGAVQVIVSIIGGTKNDIKSTFFTVSPERAYSVDFAPGGLMFIANETRTITWSPNTIVPSHLVTTSANNLTVDITLYRQELISGSQIVYKWKMVELLNTSLPNNGKATVVIPSIGVSCKYPTYVSFEFGVCPIAFKVSLASTDSSIKELKEASNLGQWSGVGFLKSMETTDEKIRNACEQWSKYDQENSTLTNLIPCPPTVRLAMFDPAFQEIQLTSTASNSRYPKEAMNIFHPGSHVCFNEAVPQNSVGQECCYDVNGILVKGQPGGGSGDVMSPRVDYNGHLMMDLAPYLLCCTGSFPNCQTYFSERPGGNEVGYQLPVPACIYGDPHIVTLDGLKYTFNGKGEFILIETEDAMFTMQGRMEPAKTASGLNALGTVFTAIVAIQNETNTSVQFEIKTTGVKVNLNGEVIDFDEIKEIKFSEVTLEDKGNATVVALFSKGTTVELRVENGIISVMLVSLPSYQKGKTRGLMGNFNGDPSDDLLPKGESIPLPSDSSMEEIHRLFGMTWIIENIGDSSFSYKPGENLFTFFDPSFIPVFEPNFNDTTLEEEAIKICGDDKFCLFDIAITKRMEIGAATLSDSENFEAILNSSKPILCDPKCISGTCVENNSCVCSQGFSGDRCQTPTLSDCDENVCQNNGTCTKHVLTVRCVCQPGYIGTFCQEKEPPFHIRLINSSPRVGQHQLVADFTTSKPIVQARCYLSGQGETNCTSGHVSFEGIPATTYIFRIVAKTDNGERAVIRRVVHVIGALEGSGADNLNICAVHLINEGLVVDGNRITARFVGVGSATSYHCRLDSQLFKKCRSPVIYQYLAVGGHRLQVQPMGEGCYKTKRLNIKFDII